VVAIDIAGLVQALLEGGRHRCVPDSRCAVEKSDHWQSRLLCVSGQRPRRRCAAEQRDELAAPYHSITSSARERSVVGILMPNVLAVGRLMTSSKLVGSWTGISAGFSPLRMRPV